LIPIYMTLLIWPGKTESNRGMQKHFCLPLATVHGYIALQQMMHPARQSAYVGERGCNFASPVSSKAFVRSARGGRRLGGRTPLGGGRRQGRSHRRSVPSEIHRRGVDGGGRASRARAGER
jgi:hypothetical protein